MREMLGLSQEDIVNVLSGFVQTKHKWTYSKVSFEFTQSQDNGRPETRVSAVIERLPDPKGPDPLE